MYQRFALVHRLVHGGVICGFLVAAVTGLPVRFSTLPWARRLYGLIGGMAQARRIHRGAAILLGLCALIHLGHLGYLWLWRRQSGLFWGPDSLVPQPSDWRDFRRHLRWFWGRGPRPRFERWAYWQKFDYWAAIAGMTSIGSTGVMLWFAPFFGRWLPGWVITLSLRLHGHEAILAVGVISLFHFFHVHLHPEKFPADPVIFSGRLDAATLRRDHGRQHRRLRVSGRLADLQVSPGSRGVERAVRWLWIVPVGLCWLLFLLVLWALIRE